jgi:hypothetical protein
MTTRKETNDIVELAPPTPTQKPRSICSSRPSDTSRPRKRPCRQSRSAPTPLSSAGVGGSAQSTSTGDVGLEMLLQRFELFNSTSSSLGNGTSTPGKGKGRDMGLDRGVLSPITRSTTTARVNQNNSVNLVQSENQRNTVSNKELLAQTKHIAPSPLSNRTNITSTNSNTNTKPIPRPPQPRAHAGKPKPFKTPFLNPPTIRSSPRRTVPPSPLRALPVQTPTRAKVQVHNANVDIGEDEGNDSFDSFDGMFQEGGPEIDELFRAVDGS